MKNRNWAKSVCWIISLGICLLTARILRIGVLHVAYDQMRIGWEYHSGDERNRDPEKAFAHTLWAARLGNRSAKNNLGMFYSGGVGVEQDIDKALVWFRRAEKAGQTGNAPFNLGYVYYQGNDVPQDLQLARTYFEQSAEKDFAPALWYLGELYRLGLGVESDPEKAFSSYWQAAMLGHGPGFRSAGWCYWNGHGVEKDPIKAYALTLMAVTYSGDFPFRQLMDMSADLEPRQVAYAEILSQQLYAKYAVPDFADVSDTTISQFEKL